MSIHLSLERFPVVVTTLVGETGSEELEAYLRTFVSDVIERHQPFVSVVDATYMRTSPSARMRRRVAEWQMKNSAEGRLYNLGVVFVTDSVLARSMLRAIQWMASPRVPMTTVATRSQAETWARSRFVSLKKSA